MATFLFIMIVLALLALVVTLGVFTLSQRKKARLQNPHDSYHGRYRAYRPILGVWQQKKALCLLPRESKSTKMRMRIRSNEEFHSNTTEKRFPGGAGQTKKLSQNCFKFATGYLQLWKPVL